MYEDYFFFEGFFFAGFLGAGFLVAIGNLLRFSIAIMSAIRSYAYSMAQNKSNIFHPSDKNFQKFSSDAV